MTADKILKEDVSDFASRLEAMTIDEVFAATRAGWQAGHFLK
ncbi:hypothetical protein [Agrobacterium fabrum]|nr:hypothetical protein [Agrobacterium fabrum]MCR6727550.1 hypothetical protein [Agrobacterium fabrum]WCK79597.1 hypothetical protein G6L39_024370 [Agrobacterium fabrum]WIE30945.1 hypothetical protein G6L42_023275 [Agrobacterium fabrum]WIE46892.1 hypothetical protein G6L76_023220 [Agrobacterium fabrum]WLP57561.1 hypothetical protein Q8X45_23945 [Agrobacterium fabrum]